MRKVLAGVLCAIAAAAPTVAFAATADTEPSSANTNTNPPASESVQLRQEATQKLRTAIQRAKHKRAVAIKHKREKRLASAGTTAAGGSSASPQLQAIAACESGGNPSAIGGGGQFRGKYQFDYGTWASVGGSGDPAAAPVAEQDKRAAMLLARSGTNPWPICG